MAWFSSFTNEDRARSSRIEHNVYVIWQEIQVLKKLITKPGGLTPEEQTKLAADLNIKIDKIAAIKDPKP